MYMLPRLKSRMFLLIIPIAAACGHTGKSTADSSEVAQQPAAPDTLYAATLYGPTSYFIYRGQEMGFDYENLRQFAEDEGMVLKLSVAPSLPALVKMVNSGEVQLAAYPVPKIEEYSKLVKHAGHKEVTWQVLVQPQGKERVSDVTELVGKTVYVEKDSKYEYRLRNLDNELGGGIEIVPISRDTLVAEDLIEMVDRKEIPMTVVDSDIAELNKSYFPNLDISMKVSLDQYSSWAVGNGMDSLAAKLDRWEKRRETTDMVRSIYKKYFEISKGGSHEGDHAQLQELRKRHDGRISPYDASFRKYSSIPGYDWEFLAAIGFNESRFDHDVVSWAGARGLMQIMPATAKAMGVDGVDTPDGNIHAAAKLLRKLDKALEEKVPDKEERLRFVAAAYNCGLGHVYDAIALAAKNGLNPQVWLGNVSEAALLKTKPQYYNDPVVKNGYFRGRETVEFVDRVMNVYAYFKKLNHRN